MTTHPPTPFADNWAYLKVELNWLERMLLMVVARQRKENKDLERIPQTRADRATNHWWKGLVMVDEDGGHDEHYSKTRGTNRSSNYQQQVDARVEASREQGIILALPALRDRLHLSLFEKNLILMSLAPEINRRYAKLYGFLQGNDRTDLPTVELVLRLLCRNDAEWRSGRHALSATAPLIQHQLVKLLPDWREEPILTRSLKLADNLVSYLLAETPDLSSLEHLLQGSPANAPPAPTLFPRPQTPVPPTTWDDLILPDAILQAIQYLCHRVELAEQLAPVWGEVAQTGAISILSGKPGTGKTMVANAIAHQLNTPLTCIDLALLDNNSYGGLMQELVLRSPTILLFKSAQVWFNRTSPLSDPDLQRLLHQRRQVRGITLLSVPNRQQIKLHWQRQMDQVIELPVPSRSDRHRLWQRAIPPGVTIADDVNWEAIARWPLTGGAIHHIARDAAIYAATTTTPNLITLAHIQEAYAAHQKHRLRRL